MQDFQPGDYRDGVEGSLARLNIILPHFRARVTEAVAALGSGDSVEENEFIDTSRLVYDGVREVRQAVLMNRGEITDTSDDEEEEDERRWSCVWQILRARGCKLAQFKVAPELLASS